jgi:hypothetical protein
MYTFITPLTEKQKFNWKALGLGVYLYILFITTWGLLVLFMEGGSTIYFIQNILQTFFLFAFYYWYLYIPLQFILYLIARRILKKNPPKSVLKFIYTSLIILAAILIITTFFPLPGIDFRFVG